MTIPLPFSHGAALRQWTVADWRAISLTSAAAAGGLAQVTFDALDTDTQWLIDRVVVQCTSSSATTLQLYDSVVTPGRLLDGTSTGNLNSNDYPAGLLIPAGGQLIAQWTGASAGAIGTLTTQVRVMKRS